MIISTVGMIGIAASHIIVGVLCWAFSTKISNSRSTIALKKIEVAQRELARLRSPESTNLVPGELVTETIPDIVMTAEEHFAYLKNQYPAAWKEYKQRHTARKILDRADRHIQRLILAYEAGEITAELGQHTLDFSNGDELWIANKYFAYGYMYRSEHNKHICYEYDHYTVSPYTFLRVVDLEERIVDQSSYLTSKIVVN